ncbi:MAG: phenylalanine--tRNA ligase subunit beta [Candidatus Aminicenantes bacterium RBG_13_63_10]|nr:MAG: phenylalanine--tRNA ligase subunit beta [Candidatus Aminicenantes bacterium RBG_13_63_10]
MKISLDWIREYVDLSLPLPKLTDKLSMIGLVVDSWEERDGDTVLDVETYANRPDTLGHRGMAREAAAALGLPLKTPDRSYAESDVPTSELAEVQVWDEDLCPRYCGLVVRGVKVGPSPDWLRRRIETMGLKPINNVVDATNYILFGTGQPIHAFDFAKVAASKIIVRRAKKGERLVSLDGVDLELGPDMLAICDESTPLALAGIIGGQASGITESTKDVFIESAHFDPVATRKTAKALGLQTDASYRFERGTDISFAPDAARWTAALLAQFGGEVSREVIDVYPKPRKKREIMLRPGRVSDLLGVDVGEEFILKTLTDLEFEAGPKQGQGMLVKIPFFRVDIEREADLIEEVARFYGYDRIPSTLAPLKVTERAGEVDDRMDRVRDILFHAGFDEVLNQAFADPAKERVLTTRRKPIEIRNPVSSKASLLRTTLLGGLLDTVAWNLNRGREGVHVFEWGSVYYWDDEEKAEPLMLGLAGAGLRGAAFWQGAQAETDFFAVKGACEALMSGLRYEPFSFQPKDNPFFEKGSVLALVYKGVKVGCLGLIKKSILDAFSLKKSVYAAELNLEVLFAKQPKPFQYAPVPRFPSVTRDLSFMVKQEVTYETIKEELERMSLPYLESYELVDRFSGPTLPKGRVSLSLRFVFRHPGATLLAGDVDKLQQQILANLKASFDIQLRREGEIDK